MPIRLPRYVPQVDIPSSVPYGQASGAAFAAPYAAAAGGLDSVSRSLGQMYADFQREALKLQAAESAVMRENLVGYVKDRYTGDELEARGAGEEPEQYEARARGALDQHINTALEQVQDPLGKALVGKELAQWKQGQQAAIRTQAFKMRIERTQAITGTLLDRDATEAIISTDPEVQRAAYARGIGRIRDLVATGVYSGEAGNAALLKFNEQVGDGTARLKFQNPAERPGVIAMLQAGKWPGIPADKQMVLANTLMGQMDAQIRRDDAAAEKAFKKYREPEMTSLMQAAVEKAPDFMERLKRQVGPLGISDTEYQRLVHEYQSPVKDNPSDPATLDSVIIGTHSLYPTMSDQELDALKARRLLSRQDWKEAKDKANATRRHNLEYGQTRAHQQYVDADKLLRAELGIPQFAAIESLDPVTKRAYARGLRELQARADAFPGGTEAAGEVIKDIVPRLKIQIGSQAQETERELVQSLDVKYRPGPYTTETGLAAIGGAMNRLSKDFSAGKISKGQLDIQVDYLRRLHELVSQRMKLQVSELEKAATTRSATPASPTRSGRGNVPAARPD